MLVNLYWSLLILAFGACVGSFLNVVIYRWPRDISLRRPIWSFCPHCQSTLGWRDNIPVFSYLLLRGRCRYCGGPISLQYPLVELITAFSFLLVYDAFFVARLREGIVDLASDWPMLLAHWALAAGLIVVTVMDLEAYLVDIRVTWIMAVVGVILHALWTPASSVREGWIRPGETQASIAVAAAVGLAIGGLLLFRRRDGEFQGEPSQSGQTDDPTAQHGEHEPVKFEEAPELLATTDPPARRRSIAWVWSLLTAMVVAGYVVMMLVQDYQAFTRISEPIRASHGRLIWPAKPSIDPGVLRTAIGAAILFVSLAVFASEPHPQEDEEIVESLNAEAGDSRRNALWELKLLIPTIALMALAVITLLSVEGLKPQLALILHYEPCKGWQPVWGIATALAGWVIGGGLAWLTRILGTLGLGKEALGMGDVHIMAAVGAIAGAIVAFLGFFIASVLALLGVVIILFRRQSAALPYGPWLALASFVVVLYQDKILAWFQVQNLLR